MDVRTLLACGLAAAAMSCTAMAMLPGRAAMPVAGAALAPATAGNMSVSPGTAIVGVPVTLGFTFTPTVTFKQGTLSLTVPPGWTAPSTTAGTPGYASATDAQLGCASPCQLPVAVNGMTITVSGLNLSPSPAQPTTMTVTYSMATAGGGASGDFTATAQVPTAGGTQLGVPVTPVAVTPCPDGTGTMTVSPGTAAVSSTGPLDFRYQAAGCGVQPGGVVVLTVPPGWPAPTQAAGAPGYTTVSGVSVPGAAAPGAASLQVSGQAITVGFPGTALPPGASVTIDYAPARDPATAGSYTFAAAEQATSAGQLAVLADGSPAVVLTPVSVTTTGSTGTPTGPATSPAGTPSPSPETPSPSPDQTARPGGRGTMTVAPRAVTASRYSTLTFTYTAGQGGLAPSGAVAVQVPAGWTAPSAVPGTPGYTRSSAGRLALTAGRISVTGAALQRGQTLTIRYRGRPGPGPAATVTFVTLVQPAGTAVLTALITSPSVTVSPAGPPGPAISLLALGVAAAVCAAAVLAIRRVRAQHVVPPPRVRAAAQPGPLPSLTVRDTGHRPTLTVRIEPHPSAAVTTLEEVRS